MPRRALWERVKVSSLIFHSNFQKNPRVRKIRVSAILGPEMGASILWTPGKNAFFLQENLCP